MQDHLPRKIKSAMDLLLVRNWFEAAIEAKGGKKIGGGVGFGQADIDVEIDGCGYNVSISPYRHPMQKMYRLAALQKMDYDAANRE